MNTVFDRQNNLERLRKTGKGIALVSRLACILTVPVMLAVLTGMVILAVPDTAPAQSLTAVFTIITWNGQEISIPAEKLQLLLFFALLYLAAMLAVFMTVFRIFRDIGKDDTPFTEKQVSRIRRVALFALLLSLINGAAEYAAEAAVSGTAGLRPDITGIVLAVVIYCMAYVFDYGCQLQRLSDETL